MIIQIAHIKEGYKPFDEKTFNQSKKDLIQEITNFYIHNISINNGDVIDSDTTEEFYIIHHKQIGTDPTGEIRITYWVHESSEEYFLQTLENRV